MREASNQERGARTIYVIINNELQVLTGELLSSIFCFVYVLLLKWEKFLATEFEVEYVITPFLFDNNAIKKDFIG